MCESYLHSTKIAQANTADFKVCSFIKVNLRRKVQLTSAWNEVRQMRVSRSMLYVPVGSDTLNIQSSDCPKLLCINDVT